MASTIEIKLFGGLEVRRDGEPMAMEADVGALGIGCGRAQPVPVTRATARNTANRALFR